MFDPARAGQMRSLVTSATGTGTDAKRLLALLLIGVILSTVGFVTLRTPEKFENLWRGMNSAFWGRKATTRWYGEPGSWSSRGFGYLFAGAVAVWGSAFVLIALFG